MKQIAIIGGGPAGMACAMQLKRYKLEPLIYEKDDTGGLLRNASIIENYPGFPFGISAEMLVINFRNHLIKYEIDVRHQEVIKVELQGNNFLVETAKGQNIHPLLVIATGTKPKRIREFDTQESVRDKVFYEVYSVRHLNDMTAGIVGAGDAAFDYAVNLSQNNRVYIFNRHSKYRCLPLLYDQVCNCSSITYLKNNVLSTLEKKNKGLSAKFFYHGEIMDYYLDYIIFATGREPQMDYLSEEIRNMLDTLIDKKKIFLIGDVKNDLYRQVSIAVGDGVKVAMEIYYQG
ncbi:MAG: NAD(P)/FAD-dependent oxidoreductase [Bacteroidetes bacterium]|nr:NAD(P)/FAD-dependent oxidoreductase [Bacteroidota bacterium]